MIKNYQNGHDFINDNAEYLNKNKYLSVFFFLDAKLLNETSNTNYAVKVQNNEFKLLALKVEPYNMLLYGDKECLRELLEYLKLQGLALNGIMCPKEIGDCLVKNHNYIEDILMDFMETNEYTEPSSNEVEKATIEDVEEIHLCTLNFFKDCGLKDKPDIEAIKKKIDQYRLIKVDGKIASMASFSKGTEDSCRISYVYTKPEYRNHGYARKIVNSIKNEILDMHFTATLNVDQKNPISNHVYSSLGFKKVYSQGIYYLKEEN